MSVSFTRLIIAMTHSRQVEDSTWTHFNTIADGYDDLYGFMHAYIADFTVEHLQLRPDDHLIDVGAGTGSTASLIWQKAGEILEHYMCSYIYTCTNWQCHGTRQAFFSNAWLCSRVYIAAQCIYM